jgi:hypothetical protein
VIASSSTVLSNLAYLIGAVVVAIVAGLAVWLHHRQPKSVDASMASFRKGLSALAPDPASGKGGSPTAAAPRAAPMSLLHVRLEPVSENRQVDAGPAAAEAVGEWVDSESG